MDSVSPDNTRYSQGVSYQEQNFQSHIINTFCKCWTIRVSRLSVAGLKKFYCI